MTTDQFNIRWNNYTSVLQSVFRKLLEGEQFVDVTLTCEGKSIKCHKVILSACSTYFEKILTENSYPHLVIFVKDMKFWELQALVTFMYNGEVSVNQNKLSNLVKAAETLRIKGLAPETPAGGDSEKIDEDDLEEYQMDGFGKGQDDQMDNKNSLLRQMKRKVLSVPPKLAKIQKVERNSSASSTSANGSSQNAIQEAVAKHRQQTVKQETTTNQLPPAEEEEEEYDNEYPQENMEENVREEGESEEELEENGEDQSQDDGVNSGDGQTSTSETEDPQAGTSGVGVARVRAAYAHHYGKDVRDSAMAALSSGISLRQCSEAFGIPRKTLSKWKQRGGYVTQESSPQLDIDEDIGHNNVVVRRPTSGTQEVSDRAERLQKAMEMAISGITVRQAAAHFDIPRTTLCAYMKRRGVASKRSFLSTNPQARKVLKQNTNSAVAAQNLANFEDFPFLGISELMDDLEQGSYDAHQDK